MDKENDKKRQHIPESKNTIASMKGCGILSN